MSPRHKMKKVSEAVARPVRTTVQGGVGLILAQFIDAWVYDMDDTKFGALVALLTVVTSYVQTTVENRNGVGFMRQVPPVDAPVIDN